jgi:GPI mannosyltransferase 3
MYKQISASLLKRPQLQAQQISIEWFFIILSIHWIMAWFYQGYSHADEHFQVLEFTAYKIHYYPFQYPWELYEKLRSSIQIWGVIGLHQFFPRATPFAIAFYTRLISGTISAYAVYQFIQTFQMELRGALLRSWFLLLSIFSYVALYQSVRYSSENLSGHFFLIGFCMLYRQPRPTFQSGLILGLSFILRYQAGFLIFGLFAWCIFQRRIPILKLIPVILGIVFCIVLGGILDSIFYETWVSTGWQYLLSNIIQNKSSAFGVNHWTYLSLAYLLPYGPFYLFGTLYFMYAQKKHIITWTIAPFIIIHILIPHKELRFLIPILSFMPFAWLYSLQMLENKYSTTISEQAWMLRLHQTGWLINGVVVILLAILLNHQTETYELLWQRFGAQAYTLNLWTEHEPIFEANSVQSGMPYRYYLTPQVEVRSFNNMHAFQCKKGMPCVVWMPCFASIRQDILLMDSCPKYYNVGNFHHWKDRASIYREKGRLYAIQD